LAFKTQGRRTSWALSAAFTISVALVLIAAPSAAWADSENTPHVAATRDTDTCAACHRAHTQIVGPGTGAGIVRDGNASTSCLGCHNVADSGTSNVVSGSRDSFALASGHSLVEPAAGSIDMQGCSACHDPHASAAERDMIPMKKINGVAVSATGPEMCLACHDEDDSWFGDDYPSTSNPTRDATGYPVAGVWPGAGTYRSADNAHRLLPETTQTIAADRDVKRQEGDCLYCHAAHRGPNEYDGLLKTFTVPTQSTLASDQADGAFAALCFECHGGVTPSGFAAAPVDIKRFVTATATATGNYTGQGGHSIITSGGTLPVGSPLPCFECHNPHGSKRGNAAQISDTLGSSLETSSSAGVRQFCFTCHTTNDSIARWDSETSSYVAVSSSDKIVGLPRDGAMLRLPTGVGHNEVDIDSCYTCHGDNYAAGGRNVHDPSVEGNGGASASGGAASATTSDTVPPSTFANLAGAYTGTVSLEATDTESGVAETLFSLDGGILTTGTVVVASGDGTHTVQFWSVDNASNVETPTIAEFLVDTTAPMTTSDALEAYVDSATVTLTSQDNTGGAGLAETFYRLDAGEVATGTVVTTSTVGTHTVDFWAVDLAGNTEATQTISFVITTAQALLEEPPLAPISEPQVPESQIDATPTVDVTGQGLPSVIDPASSTVDSTTG
jgi:predicted CXXCH cytochrome family protein